MKKKLSKPLKGFAKNKLAKVAKVAGAIDILEERGYRDVAGTGQTMMDWAYTMIGEDSDTWQNIWALTSRGRDLFRTNPIFNKYREVAWAQVYGEHGISLEMEVKETEDRIVYAPDEAKALRAHEERINKVLKWAHRKTGAIWTKDHQYRAFKLAENLDRAKHDDIIRGQATITVGQPDIYANQVIEDAWKDWQRAENCDVRQNRDYNTLRQLRLINSIRDGDIFIRKIFDPRVNRYGFTTQLITAEWCDHFYNTKLDNGNVVIMGIEYKMNSWGLGAPAAYYFIKRQPQDWQFSIPGAFNFTGGNLHIRIDASEIIHYARVVDAESTRPAPIIASTIPAARQTDQYTIAEVIAARAHACNIGVLYSDLVPEGGEGQFPIDPKTSMPKNTLSPGAMMALKWGVKYASVNPSHPTQNFPAFRKEMIRQITAGLPAADYNILASDMESVNFASGKLGRLDSNEIAKMLQRFDINKAERPIFEDWLDMALMTGAIPLPFQKFSKFNKPTFTGRRWKSADEQKDVNAAAGRIANNLSNWTIECAENGGKFDKIMFKKAENLMLMEELGIDPTLTVAIPKGSAQDPQP